MKVTINDIIDFLNSLTDEEITEMFLNNNGFVEWMNDRAESEYEQVSIFDEM